MCLHSIYLLSDNVLKGEMMVEPIEVPRELLDDFYNRLDSVNGFSAGHILGPQASEEARKTDISDTFILIRGSVSRMLSSLGVEDPSAIDHAAMYTAVQERAGFESGVKFVHENAHVTSRAEASRQSSVLHTMKTAGTMAVD